MASRTSKTDDEAPTPAAAAVCIPKRPPASRIERAMKAIETNPANEPTSRQVAMAAGTKKITAEHIAVMTTKYWRTDGVHLGVAFLDNPPRELRARIIAHMNAWGDGANIRFRESNISPEVRIARTVDDGHWSYLGTDILTIAADQPTMNLDSFTLETPDSEFYRVVRHETGHTLGCPHEHMRPAMIELIDRDKAIEYFMRTQGWTQQEVIQQVLTPLDETKLRSTDADSLSIMCYQIPGSLTHSGRPILGGTDIDRIDRDFIRLIYPMPVSAQAAVMTAAPAREAALAASPSPAPAEDGPDRARAATRDEADSDHDHDRRHDHDMVEVRIGRHMRVMMPQPIGPGTLERLSALLR